MKANATETDLPLRDHQAFDPRVNPTLNPVHNISLHPKYNTALNPAYNPALNPTHNQAMDPQHNTALKPRASAPASSRLQLFDADGKSIGFMVRAAHLAMIWYNLSHQILGYAFKSPIGYHLYSLTLEWVGYLAQVSDGSFNYFDVDAEYQGFLMPVPQTVPVVVSEPNSK